MVMEWCLCLFCGVSLYATVDGGVLVVLVMMVVAWRLLLLLLLLRHAIDGSGAIKRTILPLPSSGSGNGTEDHQIQTDQLQSYRRSHRPSR